MHRAKSRMKASGHLQRLFLQPRPSSKALHSQHEDFSSYRRPRMASGPLASPSSADWLRRGQDLILPVAIIASVLVILVPLPPALMDVLLSGNIAISVLVLLTTIYVRTPLEFS